MIIIKYLALFFILSILYIFTIFGGAILNFDSISFWIVLFLIIPITPLTGRFILKENLKVDNFYISYVILILAILPTFREYFHINYPYFIFDMMEINFPTSSKCCIAESYIFPLVFILIISLIIIVKFYKKNNKIINKFIFRV